MAKPFWSHVVRRRERWTLTWPARALVALLLGAMALAGVRNLYAFLATTRPVGGQYLVVEGWMPGFAYREAAAMFRKGGYTRIIAVSVGRDDGLAPGEQPQDSGAERLAHAGVPAGSIAVASSSAIQRDRTFHAARAVSDWMRRENVTAASLDVLTLGPHARRSHLLYQDALGSAFKVGIIAVDDPRIDPRHWWRTSQGARSVISEAIGYAYARFWFTPDLYIARRLEQ